MKDTKTLKEFYQMINKIIKNNKGAKSQRDREAIINEHGRLLFNLNERANKTDHNDLVESNPYRNALKTLYNWILQGSSKLPKDYYVNPNYRDKPSEIKDTVDVNSRLYQAGNRNYYTAGSLIPTKVELRNPRIKSRFNDLKDTVKQLKTGKGNRFTLSRLIHEKRDDLNMIIKKHRNIDHEGRTDNTVTPKQSVTTPNFDSRGYISFLLHTSLEEISGEDVRLDKMTIDKLLGKKDQILKDIERGYNEAAAANHNHVNVSTVSRKLSRITDKLLKQIN